MIRLSPDLAFLKRADTRERRLLMRFIGHPTGILAASNSDEALAHCPECNLWLLPHESCLHIPCGVA